MKKRLLSLLKLAISASLSLVILSLFCVGFNYSGVHIRNTDGSTDYKWEKNQFFSTMNEGFSWITLDKNGFNNPDDSDISEKPIDILLMGSSHMEATQLGKNENVGSLLNEKLPGLRTYNIGISGHTLYTCAQNMKDAYQVYKPSSYVILEISDIDPQQEAVKQILRNQYPEIPSYDSGLIYNIQRTIPAAKALYKGISDWKEVSEIPILNQNEENDTTAQTDASVAPDNIPVSSDNTLHDFIAYIRGSVPMSCSIIIFYHSDITLSEDGQIKNSTNPEKLNAFSRECSDQDITFVNLTPVFQAHYQQTYELPCGFINTAVGVGHLNQTGHRMIADCLCDIINEDMVNRK